MMQSSFPLLLLLLSSVAAAGERPVCRWSAQGGPAPHLIAGALGGGGIALMVHGINQEFGATLPAAAIGVVAVNLLGAAKERTDYRRGGWCSGKDLAANLIGSLAGAYTASRVMVWQTRGGTVMVGYGTTW